MKSKDKAKVIYTPGDLVLFRDHKRIVLGTVESGDGKQFYQIFHPERGIYSADGWEMEYLGHLKGFDQMISEMEKAKLQISA